VPTGARVLGIASGKGGVGKSTIAVLLALVLAQRGNQVGLLDADLYGPDVPRMLGLSRFEPATHVTVWKEATRNRPRPLEYEGIKVWSTQFLMAEAQAFSMQAGLAGLLLQRAFSALDWGDLDWLIVDMPPGTADVQQQIASLGLTAVLLVVTPQDVAHLDAKKVLTMMRNGGVPVIGGVENMASGRCPHCSGSIDIFPKALDNRTIWAAGVTKLASISFSPELGELTESGMLRFTRGGSAESLFRDLADRVSAAWPSSPPPPR
jgi:ATP-binding protein involved in chromosome partitioning